MRTLVNPLSDMRAMDEMFERFFGRGPLVSPNATNLPIDVYDRDGKLVVKAAVPGISPENLELQIEENVLTIRGEIKSDYEDSGVKVYRREMTYGSFARSIRLPEDLDFGNADAEFDNGFVTISFPRIEQPQAKPIQIPVKSKNSGPQAIQTKSSSEQLANNGNAE